MFYVWAACIELVQSQHAMRVSDLPGVAPASRRRPGRRVVHPRRPAPALACARARVQAPCVLMFMFVY